MGNVTVVSKLPHGLLIDHKGVQVELNGANSTKIRDHNGLIPEGAFGTTTIDESLWSEWSTTNASLEFLKKGLVFAKPTEKSAIDQGEQSRDLKTGLEGLRQDMKDDRLPQRDQNRLKGDVVLN